MFYSSILGELVFKISECYHNCKVELLQQLNVRHSRGAHNLTPTVLKSVSSCLHSVVQIWLNYTWPSWSVLVTHKADDWFQNHFAFFKGPECSRTCIPMWAAHSELPRAPLRSTKKHKLTSPQCRLESIGKGLLLHLRQSLLLSIYIMIIIFIIISILIIMIILIIFVSFIIIIYTL